MAKGDVVFQQTSETVLIGGAMQSLRTF